MKQSQFILDRVPGITVAQITEILKANSQFERETLQNKPICAFCKKELTDEEKKYFNVYAYSRTCKEHRAFENVFQVDYIIKKHNIPQHPLPYEFDCN